MLLGRRGLSQGSTKKRAALAEGLGTILNVSRNLFDKINAFWEERGTQRVTGTLVLLGFMAILIMAELNRQGFIPEGLGLHLPSNPFFAVNAAFTLLLFFEIIALVFSLSKSVASSLGKQFEVFSLFLLRRSFEELTVFDGFIGWQEASDAIMPMFMDALGAFFVFTALGFFYRFQRHTTTIPNTRDLENFINSKKLIGLALLGVFVFICVDETVRLVAGVHTYPFFEAFYTVLIFSDILIVLLSLRYSQTYRVVFRNSGFVLATVFMRLAMTAPDTLNAIVGVASILLALCLTLAYNAYESFGIH